MSLEEIMREIIEIDTQLKELRDKRRVLGRKAFKMMDSTDKLDTQKKWRMRRREDVDVTPTLTERS